MVHFELGHQVLCGLHDGFPRGGFRDGPGVMTVEFFATPADNSTVLPDLAAHAPENPFLTSAYFKARKHLGAEAWIIGLKERQRLHSAAGAFITRGRLNSRIEVASLPAAAADRQYWSGLLRFASQHRITEIEGNSFASPMVTVPVLTEEVERTPRCEYLVDLNDFRIDNLSSNHRRNIRKASVRKLTSTRSTDLTACREHVRLMSLSHDRRRRRGEVIHGGSDVDRLMPLLTCGCGELFQASADREVLSSILVLRASKGAYYQSAGTAPEGMTLGASHFLIYSVMCQLKEDGVRVFNLGGAPVGSTLARFKGGFGAAAVSLTSVMLYTGSRWRSRLTTLVKLARSEWAEFSHESGE